MFGCAVGAPRFSALTRLGALSFLQPLLWGCEWWRRMGGGGVRGVDSELRNRLLAKDASTLPKLCLFVKNILHCVVAKLNPSSAPAETG